MFPALMGKMTFGRMAKAGRRMRMGDLASDSDNAWDSYYSSSAGAAGASGVGGDMGGAGVLLPSGSSGNGSYSGPTTGAGPGIIAPSGGSSDPFSSGVFSWNNSNGSTSNTGASASGVSGSASNSNASSSSSSSWLDSLGSAVGSIFGSAAKAASSGTAAPVPPPASGGIFGSSSTSGILVVGAIGLAAYLLYSEEKSKRSESDPALSGYRKHRRRHHRR